MTRLEILDFLIKASTEELSYIKGRYCGPHNVILAEKRFGYGAKYLNKCIEEELFKRSLDDILDYED